MLGSLALSDNEAPTDKWLSVSTNIESFQREYKSQDIQHIRIDTSKYIANVSYPSETGRPNLEVSFQSLSQILSLLDSENIPYSFKEDNTFLD